MIHDVGQEYDLCVSEPYQQDRSFDVVRVKYINLDNVQLLYSQSYNLAWAKDEPV